MRSTTWYRGKKPVTKTKFICYRRNILLDYGVQSVQQEIEADTIIEAAMAYWNKNKTWPDEIYSGKAKTDAYSQLETLKYNTSYIKEQRDRFANSLAVVESERERAYHEIDEIYELVRQAIVAVNMKMKSAPEVMKR